MATSIFQESFNAGEISKRLRGHISSDLYKRGLDYCNNFRPTPQGSLLMRAGTEKIRKLTGGADTRLIRFRMTDAQDYLLELVGGKLGIYSVLTGLQETVVKRNLAANGTMDGSGGWTETANNSLIEWVNGRLHLKVTDESGGTSGHIPRVSQKITLPIPSVVTIKGQFITDEFVANSSHKLLLGTAPSASEYALIEQQMGAEDQTVNKELVANGGVALPAGDYYLTMMIGNVAADTGDIPGGVWFDNVEAIAEAPGFDIDIPWSNGQLKDVQFEAEPGIDRLIFTHPNVQTWFLQYKGAGRWDFGFAPFSSIPKIDPSDPLSPPLWADDHWPGTVEVFGGRVFLAGTPIERTRFVASRSGTAFDFTTGTNPGDALDYKLATKGSIKWLRGQRTLLCGTDIAEHSISIPISSTLPLPQIKEESSFGSAGAKALNIGSVAAFLTSDRREVRAMAYAQETGGYDSKALTFTGEHLFSERGGSPVKEIHHIRHPEGTLICVQDSGKLALCAVDLSEQVVAWWRADVGGEIISMAVSQGPLGAFAWMVVHRGAEYILEKLPLADKSGICYLDSWVSGAIVPRPGTEYAWFVGLDHLANGTKVSVFIDGEYQGGDFTVQDGGVPNLSLDHVGKVGIAGIPFRAKAVTLPRYHGFGKVSNPKIGVVLNESALPMINSKTGPERTPATNMDESEPLKSGKFQLGNLGSDTEGKITVEQDLPFRTEILALYSITET